MSTNPFAGEFAPRVEDRRIGFGPRLVATIIDGLATALFTLVLSFVLLQFGVQATDAMKDTLDQIVQVYEMFGISQDIIQTVVDFIPAAVLAGMISGIAYPLIEGLTGASPGKRVMKICVARPDATKGDTTLYLKRYGVKNSARFLEFLSLSPALGYFDWMSDIVGLVIFVGCFLVLGVDRLALHDRIAGTAVYYQDEVK